MPYANSPEVFQALLLQLQNTYDTTLQSLKIQHKIRTKLLELAAQAQLEANLHSQLLQLSDPGTSAYLYSELTKQPQNYATSTAQSLCGNLFWSFPTPGIPSPDYDYGYQPWMDAISPLWDTYFELSSPSFGQTPDLTSWTAALTAHITTYLETFTEGTLPPHFADLTQTICQRRSQIAANNVSWPHQWDHSSYTITITPDVPCETKGQSKLPYWCPSHCLDTNPLYILLHTDPLIITEPANHDNNYQPTPHTTSLMVGFIHLYLNTIEPLPTYCLRAISIAEPVQGKRLASRLLQATFDHLNTLHPTGWTLQRSRTGLETPAWFTPKMTEKLLASGATSVLPAFRY